MDPLAPLPQIALPGLPQVGDTIAGKYRIEGLLGVGGMGVVVGARHQTLGQLVAIKILSTGETQPKDAVERFLREGRAAAGLTSDHVVRIYDVGQLDNGVPFMVMERLRGRDLANLLVERGPLPVAEAIEYVAQATMAIAEAHEVGVVHRDLKPANLFLTQRSDGTPCVKVLDFGISKQLSMFESHTLRGDLTSTRQVMGSPAYMSPEQVRDARTVDHRTDIWALGTTLYELLTRHVAFDADTLPAVCAAIAADPPTPIEIHRSDVPDKVASIVMRCLEKSPDQRYQSARALLSALRAQQGRPDALVSSRDIEGPLTVASIAPARSPEHDSRNRNGILESGERSVGTAKLVDSQDGTLMSRRGTANGVANDARGAAADPGNPEPARRAAIDAAGDGASANAGLVTVASSRKWRKRLGVALVIGLGLLGAVTSVFAFRTYRHPNSVVPDMTASFSLRIESDPSGATIFEGEHWLGETPLVLPVLRSSVLGKERRFTVRKAGYADAAIVQGDCAGDRQIQIGLTREATHVAPVLSAIRDASREKPEGTTPPAATNNFVQPKGDSGLHSRGVKASGSRANQDTGQAATTSVPDIRVVR